MINRVLGMACLALFLSAEVSAQTQSQSEQPREQKAQRPLARGAAGPLMMGCQASCTTQGQPAITYSCTAQGAGAVCNSPGGNVAKCQDATGTVTCTCNPNQGCR